MKMHEAEDDEIRLASAALDASPHQLIELLLDKALNTIDVAIICMQTHDDEAKKVAINKILNIINYLRICLDFDDLESKKISTAFDSMYSYVQNILLKARVSNNEAMLSEAHQIVINIKNAWHEVPHK